MKNKNKIIIVNPIKPSSEDINKLQDFNAVLNTYKVASKPFYKNTWFVSALATLLVVSAIFTFYKIHSYEPIERLVIKEASKHERFIKPAMASVAIPFEAFEVESGKATVISTKSGTKIIIPDCPFVDGKGNSIKGKLTLKYREFRDPVEFALSGIPMDYDSAGKKYHFESAGMCELLGVKESNAVFVNKKCPLQIDMKPIKTDPKFNLYYLDTLIKNWVYLGKSNQMLIDKPLKNFNKSSNIKRTNAEKSKPTFDEFTSDFQENELIKLHEKIELVKNRIIYEPQKANIELPHFKPNSSFKLCESLAPFQNITFEINEEDKKRGIELINLPWDTIIYTQIDCGKSYKMHMEQYERNAPTVLDSDIPKTKSNVNIYYRKARKEILIVHPVFEGANFQTAKGIFNQLTLEKKREEMALREQEKRLKEYLKPKESILSKNKFNYSYIRNAFKVERFGIYNSDCPFKQNNEMEIELTFVDDKEEFLHVDLVYQLVLNKNTIMTYYYKDCCNNKFTFLPSDSQILFTVLENDTIAYYSLEDCKKLPKSGATTIHLKISERKFQTVSEIKSFLGINGTN